MVLSLLLYFDLPQLKLEENANQQGNSAKDGAWKGDVKASRVLTKKLLRKKQKQEKLLLKSQRKNVFP